MVASSSVGAGWAARNDDIRIVIEAGSEPPCCCDSGVVWMIGGLASSAALDAMRLTTSFQLAT